MHIFAINLKREPQKRQHIENEFKKLSLDFEFFDAVDGKQLSDECIQKNVYDFPNCGLTKGEIGCALSHYYLYKKIVEDNLPYALIVEDDALLDNQLPALINDFECANISKGIFVLTSNFTYLKKSKFKIGNFDFYSIWDMVGTHGYIVTKESAKKLVNYLFPIRYEADSIGLIRILAKIKVYASIPSFIKSNDDNKQFSSLENDRRLLGEKRSTYRKKIIRKDRNKKIIYYLFYQLLIREIEKKVLIREYYNM